MNRALYILAPPTEDRFFGSGNGLVSPPNFSSLSEHEQALARECARAAALVSRGFTSFQLIADDKGAACHALSERELSKESSLFAEFVAEILLRTFREKRQEGEEKIFEIAWNLAADVVVTGDAAEEWLITLVREAESFVAERKGAVMTLARELDRWWCLTGAQVQKLLSTEVNGLS